ncbi:MAG: hypothetical protein HYY25_07625 [Candidatus Wallbacteria bacterium]|nr:hypothetical protein [Candidatus Wallbacteria bacterium]
MIILEELEELERDLGQDGTPLRQRLAAERGQIRERRVEKRLGEILVEEGNLSATDLERALEEQSAIPEIPLGKLLVKLGYVSAFKVYKALGKQYGIDPSSCKDVRPIGEQLVADGVITAEQLARALAIQREGGGKEMLGRVLVRLGYADLHQIYEALCHQLARILYHLASEVQSRDAIAEQLELGSSE